MNDWWKIGILAAVLAGSYGLHKYFETKAVNNAVTVTTNSIQTVYQKQLIAAQQAAAQATASLNSYKSKADADKTQAVADADARSAATIASLQSRPTRSDLTSSVASAVARAKSSCTGAGLYRDDANFLAGFASDAAKVVIDRDYYYGQYENARRTLAGQGTNAGHSGTVPNSKPISGSGIQH